MEKHIFTIVDYTKYDDVTFINTTEQEGMAARNKKQIQIYEDKIATKKPWSYTFSGAAGGIRFWLHYQLKGWDYILPSLIIDKKYIDYIKMEHFITPEGKAKSYDSRLYAIKSKLRSTVNKSALSVISKTNLYKHESVYVPLTYSLKDAKLKDGMWIIKTATGFGGKGNTIIKYNEIDKYKKRYGDQEVIVSQYITNPLLFDTKKWKIVQDKGRKLHFRCIFMVTSWGEFNIFDLYDAIVSGANYKNEDFNDPKIHDTHRKYIQTYISSPGDINDYRIHKGVYNIIADLCTIFRQTEIKSYNESKYGYQLLGLDVLFDDKYKPWLLEVNTTPGFASNKEFIDYEKELFLWEYTCAIERIFEPLKIVKDKDNDKIFNNYSVFQNETKLAQCKISIYKTKFNCRELRIELLNNMEDLRYKILQQIKTLRLWTKEIITGWKQIDNYYVNDINEFSINEITESLINTHDLSDDKIGYIPSNKQYNEILYYIGEHSHLSL